MSNFEVSGVIVHSPSPQMVGLSCMLPCGREQLLDLVNQSVSVLATNDAGISRARFIGVCYRKLPRAEWAGCINLPTPRTAEGDSYREVLAKLPTDLGLVNVDQWVVELNRSKARLLGDRFPELEWWEAEFT